MLFQIIAFWCLWNQGVSVDVFFIWSVWSSFFKLQTVQLLRALPPLTELFRFLSIFLMVFGIVITLGYQDKQETQKLLFSSSVDSLWGGGVGYKTVVWFKSTFRVILLLLIITKILFFLDLQGEHADLELYCTWFCLISVSKPERTARWALGRIPTVQFHSTQN